MGLFPKVANFLGIDKFGKGLASAGRVLSGGVDQDRQNQEGVGSFTQKLLYAAKRETDPTKRAGLLRVAKENGIQISAEDIDPGLKLTNKEVLGSAANVVLNVATPGAFKGGKAAVVAKNAALGAGFGTASGLEKNRSASGIAGSTAGGALIGGAIGAVGLFAKAAKDFVGNKVPEWMMNKAVKPALQDLKKNVRFGSDTLGKQLLDEGIKGGPKKLLQMADDKLHTLETELHTVLTNPNLAEARINKQQLLPQLSEMMARKSKIPGGGGDVQRINGIFNDLPEKMTLPEANEIKRAIYQELRDPAYKLDAKLGVKAETLKHIARGLKEGIEKEVGGTVVSDINRKLSIYGRLENSMVDQLAREMRNNGLGLTDAILLAGGQTGVLALLRHLGKGTETFAAQALHQVSKVGEGITARTAKSALKRTTLNAP